MINVISKLFGSGVIGTVEKIASDLIETDLESAEAKALFIKTLDPNGMMRRDISRFACIAYGFYLLAMMLLAFCGLFVSNTENITNIIKLITDLFVPITTAWGGIVAASFGVNTANVIKGK